MAPTAISEYPDTTINYNNKVNFIDLHHGDDETNATGLASKALVQRVLKERIAQVDTDTCEPGEEDAFYVADLGEVYRQHLRWKMNLARVKPFYGMSYVLQKANRWLIPF
jgi:ornithine decarboxylase